MRQTSQNGVSRFIPPSLSGELQTRAEVETALDDVECLVKALERERQGAGYALTEALRHGLVRFDA